MQKAEARAHLEKHADIRRMQLHKGRIITLVQDEVFYDNGQEAKVFDMVLHPGAVAMLPINSKGELILVKQWRHAAKKILFELPAGTLEPNEDPINCAQRELREETGYEAKEITLLNSFFTAPGFCNEYIYLYLAKNLHLNPLIGDDSDEIDLITTSLEQAICLIKERKIIDAKTIAGIYFYGMNA